MTYTLYFTDGNTYTDDFANDNMAQQKGAELAAQYNTEFDYLETVQGCRFFAENCD